MRRAISQSQARALAEQHARAELGEFAYAAAGVLKDGCLEAAHCWMYFVSDAIVEPADSAPGVKRAHVVGKDGRHALVQDHSDEPDRVQACLQTMSDYFRMP